MIKIFDDYEQNEFLVFIEKNLVKVIKQGYNSFIVDFNINVDLSVIEVLIKLKQKHKHLVLGAMITGVVFNGVWTRQDQIRYFNCLNKFDKILVTPHFFDSKQVFHNTNFCLPNIMATQICENASNLPFEISVEEMAKKFKQSM